MNHRPARLLVGSALVAWAGLLLQLVLSVRLSFVNGNGVGHALLLYFGYFTVLTNLFAALVLTLPGVAGNTAAGRFFARPGVATSATASILLVALAYHFLLRRTWDPHGWQLVADCTLHYVTPLLCLLCWARFVPKPGLRWWHIGAWGIWPAAYLVYMLVRGRLTGMYPYPFLDAPVLGVGRTLQNVFGLLVAFGAVSLVLLGCARLRGSPAESSSRGS